MLSSGIFRRVDIVSANVSEERIASIISVTNIGKLGTSAINSNQRSCEETLYHGNIMTVILLIVLWLLQ
jgi:hypothetical protein